MFGKVDREFGFAYSGGANDGDEFFHAANFLIFFRIIERMSGIDPGCKRNRGECINSLLKRLAKVCLFFIFRKIVVMWKSKLTELLAVMGVASPPRRDRTDSATARGRSLKCVASKKNTTQFLEWYLIFNLTYDLGFRYFSVIFLRSFPSDKLFGFGDDLGHCQCEKCKII